MFGTSFIKGASGSAGSKTEIYLIFVIFILFGRSSLYIINPRIFKILKGPNLVKFNLSLSRVVWINVIFVFSVLYKRYTLSLFLRVGPQTLFLLMNFFIFLLKKLKFCQSLFYNLWISFIIIIICGTSSLHFLIFIKMLVLNPLFIKNGVLLVILCSDILYASIPIGNSLTQLVC